jgi:hypothetical protein
MAPKPLGLSDSLGPIKRPGVPLLSERSQRCPHHLSSKNLKIIVDVLPRLRPNLSTTTKLWEDQHEWVSQLGYTLMVCN